MTRFTKILTLSALALALGACSNIERSRNLGNPQVSGYTLAQQGCSTCHGGSDGLHATGTAIHPPYPHLAGQQAIYLEAEMQEFHDHTRKDAAARDMMWGLASQLTPAQMKALAEFYAQQKPLPNPAQGDPVMVAAGQKLFVEGMAEKSVPSCATCHGANAQGNGPIPRLAGQHADYLYKQMVSFNSDAGRENHPEALERPHAVVMDAIAHGLSDEQKHQVAAYLQSIQ